MITRNRSSIVFGHAPLAIFNNLHGYDRNVSLYKRIPADLTFRLRHHIIIAQAIEALMENGLKCDNIHQERAVCILIKVFDAQLTELEHEFQPLKGRHAYLFRL